MEACLDDEDDDDGDEKGIDGDADCCEDVDCCEDDEYVDGNCVNDEGATVKNAEDVDGVDDTDGGDDGSIVVFEFTDEFVADSLELDSVISIIEYMPL